MEPRFQGEREKREKERVRGKKLKGEVEKRIIKAGNQSNYCTFR